MTALSIECIRTENLQREARIKNKYFLKMGRYVVKTADLVKFSWVLAVVLVSNQLVLLLLQILVING